MLKGLRHGGLLFILLNVTDKTNTRVNYEYEVTYKSKPMYFTKVTAVPFYF